MKVLIVDDSPEARYCLREQLQVAGHTVVGEAEDLDGAVKAYDTSRPNVVMLDMTLEKHDGITVLKALRQLDPAAKVIILSANEMERIKKQALAAGAAAYLVKPVDEGQLLALLRSE